MHTRHEFLLRIAGIGKKLIFIGKFRFSDRFDKTERIDAAHAQRIRTVIAFFFRHTDKHIGDIENLFVARRAVKHGAVHHFLKTLRFDGFGALPVPLHCGHGHVFFDVFVDVITDRRDVRTARFEQIAYRIEGERGAE